MILAIDTATQYAGLALYNQDGIYAEESWYAGRNHTIELMPRVVRMRDGRIYKDDKGQQVAEREKREEAQRASHPWALDAEKAPGPEAVEPETK